MLLQPMPQQSYGIHIIKGHHPTPVGHKHITLLEHSAMTQGADVNQADGRGLTTQCLSGHEHLTLLFVT